MIGSGGVTGGGGAKEAIAQRSHSRHCKVSAVQTVLHRGRAYPNRRKLTQQMLDALWCRSEAVEDNVVLLHAVVQKHVHRHDGRAASSQDAVQ